MLQSNTRRAKPIKPSCRRREVSGRSPALQSRGIECQHVIDIGLGRATDAEIWDYASRNGCVVISKDEDFLYLADAEKKSQARMPLGAFSHATLCAPHGPNALSISEPERAG